METDLGKKLTTEKNSLPFQHSIQVAFLALKAFYLLENMFCNVIKHKILTFYVFDDSNTKPIG